MVLLLDAGNSRLKICLYDTVQKVKPLPELLQMPCEPSLFVQHVVAIDLKEVETGRRLTQAVSELTEKNPQMITNVWAVSVSGAHINQRIADQLKSMGLLVQWLKPLRSQLGLYNRYSNPDQLGADRWSAALGLHARFKRPRAPLILANFGTATTIDTLSNEPSFMGGLILPGVDMMFDSLAKRTAQLPLAQGAAIDHPTDTDSAIVSGVLAAQIGALKHQCDVAFKIFGMAPIVCVSGGAWPKVQTAWSLHVKDITFLHFPHIVLEGLAAVAAENQADH